MSKPQRTCVACRQIKPKQSLVRVAITDSGTVVVDAKKKMQSRGAYICRNLDCIDKAAKRHAFERHLRTEVSEELFIRLKEEIDE